jgi:hypothetical protein
MHEECFLCPVLVPHQKVEGGVFLESSLDFKASPFCNLFLDLILGRHVGDRRWLMLFCALVFSRLKPFWDRFLQDSLYVDLIVIMALREVRKNAALC